MPAACQAEAEACPSRSAGDRDAALVTVRADAGDAAVLDCLRAHGCCVLSGALSELSLRCARTALEPFLAEVQRCWDAEADQLKLASWTRYGVTRLPRVNAGKKNAHLSPEGAPGSIHAALAALAQTARLAPLLSAYAGTPMSLTESGLSLTRGGGSGMEWHADGSGIEEATVLLSLEDVDSELGALGLAPGSHAHYDAAAGGVDGAAREKDCVCWNAYRAGDLVLLDARLLHGAADNRTDRLRCVAWLIFNAQT
jgi:hypothetical protein